MKKNIVVICFLICTMLICYGCKNTSEDIITPNTVDMDNVNQSQSFESLSPNYYYTLEEFIQAVKNDNENLFCALDKDYYYAPKNIPVDYELATIEVLPMWLTFTYKKDINDLDETPMMYRWTYTGYGNGNEVVKESLLKRGAIKIEQNSYSEMDIYSDTNYSEAYEKKDKSIGWSTNFFQHDEAFQALIPWNIDPKLIDKALVMEKVNIE